MLVSAICQLWVPAEPPLASLGQRKRHMPYMSAIDPSSHHLTDGQVIVQAEVWVIGLV